MKTTALVLIALASISLFAAENSSAPLGEPGMDPPTLHCLGFYWIISGDDNQNAEVAVAYRQSGTEEWKTGMPLFRVERGANDPRNFGSDGRNGKPDLNVPSTAWLFAGSIVTLTPGTSYEVRLSLHDPDGGDAQKTLSCATITEPVAPPDLPVLHVIPGSGGGSGSESDSFKGLAEADKHARPGVIMDVHEGVYKGTFTPAACGAPGKPIIWRGRPGAVIDAMGADGKFSERGISATDLHDVWFEKLTVYNATWGLVGHRSESIVVRRCKLTVGFCGIAFTNNSKGNMKNLFITDNVLEGPKSWPRKEDEDGDSRGIQVSGLGNIVAYNYVHNFSDTLDTWPSDHCCAIDFHNNDCNVAVDDGIELDYSQRNTRCFMNRFTNVFQGVSTQPVFGGPAYVFRNILQNVQVEPFKMHNSPSGALYFHNTVVKVGMPLVLETGAKVRNFYMRNNLFVGTEANYAYESTAPMINCDFDYCGFAGGPFARFLKWNGKVYKSFDEMIAGAPVFKHALLLDSKDLFESSYKLPADYKIEVPPALNAPRLNPASKAVDAGEFVPNFSDGFAGKAPDLGAWEVGSEAPHYGPRPEGK